VRMICPRFKSARPCGKLPLRNGPLVVTRCLVLRILQAMFQHEGPARSERNNRLVAAYLAWTGGYVNSAGFVLLGIFTSHVTGNVGRLATDISRFDLDGTLGALVMIGAFFSGAVVASVILESAAFRSRSKAYGAALALEATLIIIFILLPDVTDDASRRLHDSEAALICASMGLQNSLVTRLSGAVVRTTHLTGVLTDLGIEVARWLRWGRALLARRFHIPLALGAVERPTAARVRLLSTITMAFTLGAISGAWAASWLRHEALFIPFGGLALASLYAFATGRKLGSASTTVTSPTRAP
jgi:uncharacterized membrane protein YoaK (UPF0700 family)